MSRIPEEIIDRRLGRIGPLDLASHTELVRRSLRRQEEEGITDYEPGQARLALPHESLVLPNSVPLPFVDYGGGVHLGNSLEASHGAYEDPQHSGSDARFSVMNPNTGGLYRVTAHVPLDPSNPAITDPSRSGAIFTASTAPTGHARTRVTPSMVLHTGPGAELQALRHSSGSTPPGQIHTVNPRQFQDFVMEMATGTGHAPSDDVAMDNAIMYSESRRAQRKPFKYSEQTRPGDPDHNPGDPFRTIKPDDPYVLEASTSVASEVDQADEASRMLKETGEDFWGNPQGVQYVVGRKHRKFIYDVDAG
jgi:hypothetical protein